MNLHYTVNVARDSKRGGYVVQRRTYATGGKLHSSGPEYPYTVAADAVGRAERIALRMEGAGYRPCPVRLDEATQEATR